MGNSKFDEIREICSNSLKSGKGYHLTSNLSWHRYLRQIENLARILPENSDVLDVGCGRGFTSAILASERRDLRITAIDLNFWESWKKLKNYGVKYQVGDATSMKFKDKSFDVILTFGVLEHSDNKTKFLDEIRRVLKNKGKFFIFYLPNKFSLSEFFARKIKVFHHDYTFTIGEIRKILRENGFNIRKSNIEFLVPAQVSRISDKLGRIFNHHYLLIHGLDTILTKTPLKYLATNIYLECERTSS